MLSLAVPGRNLYWPGWSLSSACKASTAKSKQSTTDFDSLKSEFLRDVPTIVFMEDIKPDLIFNWDQTGVKIVLCSSWTFAKKGSKRVEIYGLGDKRQITALLCRSLIGDFLPIQLVYKGKTDRWHPKFSFPAGWHVIHAPKHWSTEPTMIQYISEIFFSHRPGLSYAEWC